MNERIVCAANATGGDEHTMVLGIRHCDRAMRYAAMPTTIAAYPRQGFITNKGRWVDRQEAWKIAEAEGQIIRRVGGDDANGGTLYSENLY